MIVNIFLIRGHLRISFDKSIEVFNSHKSEANMTPMSMCQFLETADNSDEFINYIVRRSEIHYRCSYIYFSTAPKQKTSQNVMFFQSERVDRRVLQQNTS